MITYIYYILKKNLNTFFLWSPSKVLARSVDTWLQLSCIQLKGQYGLLIIKHHVATFVHMLMRQIVLSVWLQEKLTKLIINLTAWRNA